MAGEVLLLAAVMVTVVYVSSYVVRVGTDWLGRLWTRKP